MSHRITLALAAAAMLAVMCGPAAAQSFEGRKKCSSCHKSQAESWGDTAHAKAMESLKPNTRAEAKKKAEGILKLETEIAKVHWTNVESRDANKRYNPWKAAEFAKKAPGFDWKAYFEAAGLGEQEKQRLVERAEGRGPSRASPSWRCSGRGSPTP